MLGGLTGAAYGENSTERPAQRNGYRSARRHGRAGISLPSGSLTCPAAGDRGGLLS